MYIRVCVCVCACRSSSALFEEQNFGFCKSRIFRVFPLVRLFFFCASKQQQTTTTTRIKRSFFYYFIIIQSFGRALVVLFYPLSLSLSLCLSLSLTRVFCDGRDDDAPSHDFARVIYIRREKRLYDGKRYTRRRRRRRRR